MNILVTGSSGWLGQTLVPRLEARDGPLSSSASIPMRGATNRLSSDRSVESCAWWCGRRSGTRKHRGHRSWPPARHKARTSRRHDNSEFVGGERARPRLNLWWERKRSGGAGGVRRLCVHLDHVADDLAEVSATGPKRAGAKEAAWIDETMTPLQPAQPSTGVTKLAAEDLCRLFHQLHRLAD